MQNGNKWNSSARHLPILTIQIEILFVFNWLICGAFINALVSLALFMFNFQHIDLKWPRMGNISHCLGKSKMMFTIAMKYYWSFGEEQKERERTKEREKEKHSMWWETIYFHNICSVVDISICAKYGLLWIQVHNMVNTPHYNWIGSFQCSYVLVDFNIREHIVDAFRIVVFFCLAYISYPVA